MKQLIKPPTGQLKIPSLADTLNAGAGVFLRRPWVVIIPVLIDSWLRWTPRIAPDWLVDWLQRQLSQLEGKLATTNLPVATLQASTDALRAVDLRHNLVILDRFSTLLGGQSPAATTSVWMPANWLMFVLLVVGLNLAALFASTLFLLPLTEALSDQQSVHWLKRVGPVSRRLFGYLALLIGIVVLIGAPILVCLLWLAAINLTVALVASGIWLVAMVTIWVFGSFGIEAILLTQANVWLAAYQSYNIVQTYFWDTLLLVSASFILTFGFQQLLTPLLSTVWGSLLASIAFGGLVATLGAARMLFYQDRLARLARKSPVFMAR